MKTEIKTRKTVALCGGAEAHVNLLNGENIVSIPTIADEEMGIEISHILHQNGTGENTFCCGNNLRLNLHEKFVKNENPDIDADYIYTDCMGDTYKFKEYFYYVGDDKLKRRITRDNVSVLEDGTLTYNDGTSTYIVEREITTYDGMKASTKLEGVKNVEYYDSTNKKLDEAKSRRDSLAESISEYVIITSDGKIDYETTAEHESLMKLKAKICNEIKNSQVSNDAETPVDVPEGENIESNLPKYAIQKSNILNLKALDNQRESIETNIKALQNSINYANLQLLLLNNQREDTQEHINQIKKQSSLNWSRYKYLQYEINKVDTSPANPSNISDKLKGQYMEEMGRLNMYSSNGENQGTADGTFQSFDQIASNGSFILSWGEAANLRCYNRALNPSITVDGHNYDQIQNIEIQLVLLNEQLEEAQMQLLNVTDQINEILLTKDKAIDKLKMYFEHYAEANKEFEKNKSGTPVSFVMSETGVKGFNENGDLVVMYNKNGDYVAFEYERYFVGNNTKYRIARIYDSKERTISLVYNNKTNLLCEITNFNGETVTIEYIGTKIKKIIYPNKSFLKFFFEDGLFRVTDKNDLRNEMLLTDNKLCAITKSTMVTSVSHGNVVKGASAYEKCFENTFTYNESKCETIFTDDEGVKHIYVFDSSTERLTGYFEEKDGVVTKTEKYTFTDLASKMYHTVKANASTLFSEPYDSYVFEDGDSSQKTVNIFNLLTEDTQSVVEGNVTKTTSSVYSYNSDDKLIRKETTFTMERISDEVSLDEKKSVELYEYNSFGSLARKQSYVEGEEATNGIDIEEHIYDKNGNEIRAIKYNSLDPSSKLYTEKEYDENGRVSAELDATGKYKTSYEYENGTSTVSAENLPNGRCLSYGYSDMDGSSAISISTKDGEENSIQVMRTNGLPTKVKSNDVEFGYAYDYKGRTTSVDMNGLVLANMEYDENETIKVSSVYEKGEETLTTRDFHGNIKNIMRVVGDKGKTIVNTYNEKDLIAKVVEYANETTNTKLYEYSDDFSKITSCTLSNNNNGEISKETFTYDNYGSVAQRNLSTVNGNTTYNYTYSDDSKRRLIQVQMVEDNIIIKPSTDNLGRNVGKAITVSNNHIINDRISYLKHGNHATNIPVAIDYADKSRISYKYDRMGNIVKVFDNGILSADYEYDKLGRLTRENNKKLNETTLFRYDNRGNILSKTVYAYTHKVGDELEDVEHSTFNYRYSPLDYLCEYGEQTVINSIVSGQPYSWKGNDIVWNGKEMVGYGTNTFTYDVAFRRTSKNNITFDYDVNGKLVRQSNGISFVYDHNSLIGFKYENALYFYRRDILGNIIAILDTNGEIVVKYTYDAWGNHKVLDSNGVENTQSTFVGNINPYRYRGYYYDTETGLYFLKTRYYDPMVGRFISMDDVDYIDPETIGGLNLFAYCNNNPVMNSDPTGHSAIFALILGITALVGLGLTAGGVASDNNTLTAVGLTMVAIPALISGVGAIAAGIGGATLTGIVGGVTTIAGIGTGLFASAEYQEAFTGSNWMLDAGMSEGWYNGLMLATATIATAGTFASSFMRAFDIKSIQQFGRFSKYGQEGYRGMKFTTGKGKTRVLSFHNHSHIVGKTISQWHWQLQKWNPEAMEVAGTVAQWIWWNLGRI